MWITSKPLPVFDAPFLHCLGPGILSDAGALQLLSYLETSSLWQPNLGAFYSQENFVVKPTHAPESLAWLFDPSALIALRQRLEATFDCKLFNRFRLVAQNLLAGQGIGIHNDVPLIGYETLRLLCYFGRRFDDAAGGHLLLLNGNTVDDVRKVIRPLHGTFVAFPLTSTSFHAVTDVVRGPRYSVSVSLWHESPDAIAGCRLSGAALRAAAQANLVPVLDASGAAQRQHHGQNLLAHLLGTFDLLLEWEARPDVCLAGLLHSVFGTESSDELPLTQAQRDSILQFVGTACLRIVQLYGRIHRSALYDTLHSATSDKVVLSEDGSVEVLNDGLWRDLLMIDVANSVDQMRAGDLPQPVLAGIHEEISKTRRALPGAVSTSASFRRIVGSLSGALA